MLVSKVEPSRVLLSFGPLLYLGKYVYCQDCYNFVFFSSTLRRQSYNNTRIHMKITLCMNMNSYYTHYGTSFMFPCSKVLDFTMYFASYIWFKMTVKTRRLLLVHSSDNIMSLWSHIHTIKLCWCCSCCMFTSVWCMVSCRLVASLKAAPLPTTWLSWCPCPVTLTHPNLRPAQARPSGYLRRVPWSGPSNPFQWVAFLLHMNSTCVLFTQGMCNKFTLHLHLLIYQMLLFRVT